MMLYKVNTHIHTTCLISEFTVINEYWIVIQEIWFSDTKLQTAFRDPSPGSGGFKGGGVTGVRSPPPKRVTDCSQNGV